MIGAAGAGRLGIKLRISQSTVQPPPQHFTPATLCGIFTQKVGTPHIKIQYRCTQAEAFLYTEGKTF